MRAKGVVGVAAIVGSVWLAGRPSVDAQGAKPEFQRAADALERVTWRTRTLVGDDRLTNWDFAIATQTLPGLTLLEGVVRAEAAVVDFVEGADTQIVSPELQKPFDWRLTPAERAATKARMGPVKLASYRVRQLPGDPAAWPALLEFAKDMGATAVIVGGNDAGGATVPAVDLVRLDTLAAKLGLTVALAGNPETLARSLDGRSRHIGIGIDTSAYVPANWREAIARLKGKLVHITLRDRSGHAGTLVGQGQARASELFEALETLHVRPLVLALDVSIVKAPADLFDAVDAFEHVVQLAYGRHFTAFSRSRPIRRDLVRPVKGETLSSDEIDRRSAVMREQIRKAIPPKPFTTPQKPRKLLVVESLQGMSHDTIPHANVMLEEMGRITGAWTTEFNNDLENLKYPKIKDYDGIFLNSIVGEFAPDPAVREGLLRFVREGGGVGGIHGTPWASRNWDEFGALFGAKSAPHRIEQGVMRVYDRNSPLVAPFAATPLNFREEYYRFEHEGANRLRWEDVRVLLTVDLDDPAIEPRPWTGYKRPDNVYPVSWIRTYGKGRMFYSSLGHMPETFTKPELVGHFFAGVQYLLGDLSADATPNPRSATSAPRSAPVPAQAASDGATPVPAVPTISQRPTGSSLGTIRVGASDNTIWFGWRVGVPVAALRPLPLSDALVKTDLLSVAHVELSDTDVVSPEVPKLLDYRLHDGERRAVVRRLRELNQQVLGYRVGLLDPDPVVRRKIFELARAIGAPLIAVGEQSSNLAEVDKLAQEFAVNVAVEARSPATVLTAVQPHSTRVGIAVTLGASRASPIDPEIIGASKDRLLLVRVQPEMGASDFFLRAYRAGIKGLSISVVSSGSTEPELVKALNAFEQAMLPAMAERVRTMVASPAGAIRGPDRLEPAMQRQIASAAPRQALRPPKQPRKLLVTDIQMYSGHSTIPHGNWLLELMGKQTGAFEPVFSNDLDLLKYPRIKEFDAVYLNNVCGMVYNDPEVREGLLRFVREGGGIGGHHAVTFSNNNWPEFADLMGGWAGAHHIETQMIKIDDPSNPLTQSFGTASFPHTDEFYIFPPSSPYSRAKQRVLLSIDVERSDRATEGRFCAACTRPDQDYGLAWIRTYGQGRAYFTPLGHTSSFYTDPRWTQHLLAAIQFILGDLEADARPQSTSAPPTKQ